MLYDEKLLMEEQTKIENAYRGIGQQYYAAHKNDSDSQFAELFAVIKASEEKMADHRATVMKANGLMVCPRCGQQINIRSLFCNFCGIRISESEEENPAENETPAEPEEVETQQTPAEQPVKEAAAETDPKEEIQFVRPPEKSSDGDDASANGSMTKVFDFNQNLGQDNADAPQEKSADKTSEDSKAVWRQTENMTESPSSKRICRNCGAEIGQDFAFCIECGTRYTAPKPAVVFASAPKPISDSEPAAETAPDSQPEPAGEAEPQARTDDAKKITDDSRTTFADGEYTPDSPTPSVRYCLQCGYKIMDSDALFCNNCGARIEEQSGDAQRGAYVRKPEPAHGKTCKFCGRETTDPEVLFCTECGSRLD